MKVLRLLAHHGLNRLSENEKEGFKIAFRYLLQRQGMLTVMLLSGILAAGFEGGTLGLLGLAVSVLSGEAGVLGVDQPRFIENIITHTKPYAGSAAGLFLFLIGLAVVAQILKSLLVYISTVAQINLAYGLQGHAQDRATHFVMALSYSEITEYPAGKLVSLVDQAGIISNVVSELSKATRAVFMVTAYLMVMLVISPVLTLISIAIFGVLMLSINQIIKKLKELSRRSFVGSIDTIRWAVEYIGAPRLLRIFSSERYAEDKIREARYRRIRADKKSNLIISMITPAFEVVTVFGAGLFLTLGYLLAGDSAIEVVPKLFVFVLVFFRIKPQILLLNNLRVSINKLLPQLEIVGEFLHPKNRSFERVGGDVFAGIKQNIEFKKVSFSYPGNGIRELSNINFRIEKGDTVALVGPSGSGKTTISSLLLGLYQPTEGQILVDGVDISTLDLASWRPRVGVVDQDVFLLNATIAENIAFGRSHQEREVIQRAAQEAGADKFIEDLADGYETLIGDRGVKLSGGQRQRISLARALMGNPELLILDEATSALDSLSEQLVQDAVEKLHYKVTILVIAHRLSTIENADNIVVLESGKIVEDGTKAELLVNDGYFAQIWELQKRT